MRRARPKIAPNLVSVARSSNVVTKFAKSNEDVVATTSNLEKKFNTRSSNVNDF
jgi:hypothetical protein